MISEDIKHYRLDAAEQLCKKYPALTEQYLRDNCLDDYMQMADYLSISEYLWRYAWAEFCDYLSDNI